MRETGSSRIDERLRHASTRARSRRVFPLACLMLLVAAIGLAGAYASPTISAVKRSHVVAGTVGSRSVGAKVIANTQLLTAGAQRLQLLRIPGIAVLYVRCNHEGLTSFALSVIAPTTTLVRLDVSGGGPRPPKMLSPGSQLVQPAARHSAGTWQVAPVSAANADAVVLLTSATGSGSGCAVTATAIVVRQGRNARTGTG